jgi:hypothetical protein
MFISIFLFELQIVIKPSKPKLDYAKLDVLGWSVDVRDFENS